ncbi:MAG: sodium:proton exchanger [Desulfitibacter sp. BRH_c19]|nr:MAG: sodium:proton exchanger [Desulfitibacter sp. BRH_c19]
MLENVSLLLLGGIMLLLFFSISFASQRIRIPSVLLFIIVGILLAGAFSKSETLHTIAEIGIVLLFFLLGLEFPLQRMLSISKKVWPAGVLDLILNLGIGFLIALLFGFNLLTAFLIGAVAYASSSSITAKMLEEKKRLANPEAEFILALLIFEDLAAPILVSFLAGAYSGAEITGQFMGVLFLKIIIMTGGAIIIGYYGFRKLSNFVEKYLEMDFMSLFAVGIAFGYAGLAIALGLSEVLGAFLAGVMLSETGRAKELEHLILPVRDITLPFFFFWFGTSISFGETVPNILFLIVLILWSIIGKIIVGFYGGRMYGLSSRVSIRAGLSLGQRGEFSAIIAAMAPSQLRVFSGIYILTTAFIGVFLFNKAPAWSKAINDKYLKQKVI